MGKIRTMLKKRWPLIFAFVTLTALMITFYSVSTSKNGGAFIYPLDDTYIHMAMAKNLANHGVWSIRPHGFTSSSSSPLWTLTLAVFFRIFGINDYIPLLLNIAFGFSLLIVFYLILNRWVQGQWRQILFLLGLIFIVPLHVLILSGMEHTLHNLLSLLFFFFATQLLTNDHVKRGKYIALLFIAPLLTSSRYEGLFMVFVFCLLLLAEKKISPALSIGAISLIPLVFYGWISITSGWYAIPNSVLLKGQVLKPSLEGLIRFLGRPFIRGGDNPQLLWLILASAAFLLWVYLKDGTEPEVSMPGVQAPLLLGGTVFLHLLFAKTGWLFRYDAYLILLALSLLGAYLGDRRVKWTLKKNHLACSSAFLVLTAFILTPYLERSASSLKTLFLAPANIYEQQYQMGRFLNRFYNGRGVIINDIGVVSYMTDVHLLDLWGLANMETAKLKRAGQFQTTKIEALAKEQNMVIAVIYDLWFEKDITGGIPSSWHRVGRWKILNNVIAGSDKISFYSTSPAYTEELRQSLRLFSGELPDSVVEAGEYLKENDQARPEGLKPPAC